jgi:hypothetical protein
LAVAATAARPGRAANPWSLAAFYQLPDPPADPARLPGWLAQVRRTGYCAHPVRLAGRVHQADIQTGEVREEYSTDAEPGGVLLKACGNRRATVCPACAETYRRDAWLNRTGSVGGSIAWKGRRSNGRHRQLQHRCAPVAAALPAGAA